MKKAREDIAEKILSFLEEKPRSIQELSERVKSNWSTINEILEELKKEKKVREIFSSKKIRLFRLARDDTYLDIPITREAKKTGFYIFNKIKKKWVEKTGKLPTNTDVLKVSVDVLEKNGLDKEIPTVWYLFGKIPLLKYSAEIDYSSGMIESPDKIDKEIEAAIEIFSGKRTSREKILQQYELYHNELYKTKEKIKTLFYKDLDSERVLKEIEEEITKFYFYSPTKEEATIIAEVVYGFVVLFEKMVLSFKKLNRFRKEIVETFNSVWELLAIYMFFDSLNNYEQFKNREELRLLYFEGSIQHRISNAKDFLSNLNSLYLSNLKSLPEKISYGKEAELIRNIFLEMGMKKE